MTAVLVRGTVPNIGLGRRARAPAAPPAVRAPRAAVCGPCWYPLHPLARPCPRHTSPFSVARAHTHEASLPVLTRSARRSEALLPACVCRRCAAGGCALPLLRPRLEVDGCAMYDLRTTETLWVPPSLKTHRAQFLAQESDP